MDKKENTSRLLHAALKRLLNGKPQRIPPGRKLSVRAVEEESGLGNGSAYYYPDLIEEIRRHQKTIYPGTLSGHRKRNKTSEETERIKLKLKKENQELKALNAGIAADQYRQALALTEALARIAELESRLRKLTAELTGLRRKNITPV